MLIPILVKGLVVEDDYTAHSSPLGHYIDFILFALKAVQAQRSASKLEDAFGKELSFISKLPPKMQFFISEIGAIRRVGLHHCLENNRLVTPTKNNDTRRASLRRQGQCCQCTERFLCTASPAEVRASCRRVGQTLR